MKMTCAIHVIVTKSSVVEEGNVHIIYDHSTQNLHFRGHAHSVSLWRLATETFIVTDAIVALHSTGSQYETAPSDILWSHQQPLAKFNTTGDRNSPGNYY